MCHDNTTTRRKGEQHREVSEIQILARAARPSTTAPSNPSRPTGHHERHVMTVNTSTETTTPDTSTVEVTTVEFEKGSWQHTLQLSATADEKVENFKELAGKRLWFGARSAIAEFASADADTGSLDPSGETLFAAIKETGLTAVTASKIKNVALAARDREDFDWSLYVAAPYGAKPKQMSLGKIDKIVRSLVKAEAQPEVEANEDSAADVAIQAVVDSAPKSANSVEGGIKVALAKAGDVDEFVKVLIDVLNGPTGAHNEAACRAFIRSFAAENAGRVRAAKPAPVAKVKATPAKDGAAKAKPAPVAVSKSKGDPNKKALPAKAEPAPVEADEDLWDDVDSEITEPVAPVAKAKPTPVKATPIKRA